MPWVPEVKLLVYFSAAKNRCEAVSRRKEASNLSGTHRQPKSTFVFIYYRFLEISEIVNQKVSKRKITFSDNITGATTAREICSNSLRIAQTALKTHQKDTLKVIILYVTFFKQFPKFPKDDNFPIQSL